MPRNWGNAHAMTDLRPGTAALSILSAMLLIGLIDNFVAFLTDSGSLWMFHALRSAMIFAMCVALAPIFGLKLWPQRWAPVLVRSFFAATGLVIYFAALAVLPITQAIAGLFTSPLFILLISVVLLGERPGPMRLAAAPIGFAGVVFVLQPWSAATSPLAPFAMLSGLFYAVAMIATRRSCRGETTMAMLNLLFLTLGLWGVLGALLVTVVAPVAPPGAEGFLLRGISRPDGAFYLWTAVQAVGSLVAVALITRAYQMAEASFVAVFEYSVLVFAALWAFLLTGSRLDGLAVAGIVLILGSGVLLAVGERRRGVS